MTEKGSAGIHVQKGIEPFPGPLRARYSLSEYTVYDTNRGALGSPTVSMAVRYFVGLVCTLCL